MLSFERSKASLSSKSKKVRFTQNDGQYVNLKEHSDRWIASLEKKILRFAQNDGQDVILVNVATERSTMRLFAALRVTNG
jgi:hypothetical protein